MMGLFTGLLLLWDGAVIIGEANLSTAFLDSVIQHPHSQAREPVKPYGE